MTTKMEQQIEVLKASFGKRNTISFEAADKLCEILDAACEDACEIMVREKIKFVWMPALNRLRNKFSWSQSRIDTLIKSQKGNQTCAKQS